MRVLALCLLCAVASGQDSRPASRGHEEPWVVFEPQTVPPRVHVVFVTGDEEYRSEEGMPRREDLRELREVTRTEEVGYVAHRFGGERRQGFGRNLQDRASAELDRRDEISFELAIGGAVLAELEHFLKVKLCHR